MREIEIGDTVIVEGNVTAVNGVGGPCQIALRDGNYTWSAQKYCQLVEPPPFSVGDRVSTKNGAGTIDSITPQNLLHRVVGDKGDFVGEFRAEWLTRIPADPKPFSVGDRVDVRTNGNNQVIDRISTRYHLEDSPDDVTHTREELTRVLPKPEPEYHVVREKDELRLERIEGNLAHCCSDRVPMSAGPEAIEKYIIEWSHAHRGIDADAARKLAAEPQIIGKCPLRDGQDGPSATAIRTGKGWHVVLTAHYVLDLDSTYLPGTPLPKPIGERIFPKIDGPYKVPT